MRKWKIPRTSVHATHRAMKREILAAFDSVLFEPYVFDHESLRPLEKAFATEMARAYAIGVNSATSGLFLALFACGIKAGDEVITVGNSDISTTAAISHCGAQPVLCDVLETDFTIDPQQVTELITANTRAILPVDLYGHPADVQKLREIADRYKLTIIEDAALATGTYDYEKPVGAFADATVFSFGAHKPLGSVGNGGMIVTDDPDLFERLRLYRGYGRSLEDASLEVDGQLIHAVEGYNLPLDPLQAALVKEKLSHLREWTAARRKVADQYRRQLKNADVQLPRFRRDSTPTFYCYTIRVAQRDRVFRTLRKYGIQVSCYYVPPVYLQPAYDNRRLNVEDVPNTTRLSEELICLPVHPSLTEADVTYVVDTLQRVL